MTTPKLTIRVMMTGALVVAAVITFWWLARDLTSHPWTRDGQVRAEIVMVAPRVTGTVVEVAVEDNQFLRQGELLFRIDPSDYELAVAAARVRLDEAEEQVAALEASVVAAQAGVREAEVAITTTSAQVEAAQARVVAEEANVAAAEAGISVAQADVSQLVARLDEATRERDRAQRLVKDGAGSVEIAEARAAAVQAGQAALEGGRAAELQARAAADQTRAALLQARAGLATSEAQRSQAEAALESARARLSQAKAELGEPGEQNVRIRAARVDLQSAELDLSWTSVLAPTDGYVTNLTVDLGDHATPGSPLLAFVDSTSFHVKGFFRETQLSQIAPGTRATVTLMGYRHQPLSGTVESIGWAINPPRVASIEGAGGLVPQIEPSFDWIRLAQRVPVRIRLDALPEGLHLVSGITASVAIEPAR